MSNIELVKDGNLLGYYDENGNFVVVGETMTDEQADRYSTEVQNGTGYYDENGSFVRYNDPT